MNRQAKAYEVARASMEFSTSSATAFSGLDWERAMMVIAFQSLPIRSLLRLRERSGDADFSDIMAGLFGF